MAGEEENPAQGAPRAAAARASRPRCRDRGTPDGPGIRYPPGPAPEKAQAGAARPHRLHRRPAHARYHRLNAGWKAIAGVVRVLHFNGVPNIPRQSPPDRLAPARRIPIIRGFLSGPGRAVDWSMSFGA